MVLATYLLNRTVFEDNHDEQKALRVKLEFVTVAVGSFNCFAPSFL
jgi:hypothetical protein